jgi:hypothetical protein
MFTLGVVVVVHTAAGTLRSFLETRFIIPFILIAFASNSLFGFPRATIPIQQTHDLASSTPSDEKEQQNRSEGPWVVHDPHVAERDEVESVVVFENSCAPYSLTSR